MRLTMRLRLKLLTQLCRGHRGNVSLRALATRLALDGQAGMSSSSSWLRDELGEEPAFECDNSKDASAAFVGCERLKALVEARTRLEDHKWRQQRCEHAREFVR